MTESSGPGEFPKTFWTGGDAVSLPRMLSAGALVWAVYSAVAVLAHGVVLDEVIMPAQIIAGAVHYPPGHPHLVFYPQAYSLPNYLWALLWKLLPNTLILSATRDFLFIFFTVYAAFAFPVVLLRRPSWGHLAAVITVTEAGLRIQGFYPIWVFPNFYSHGHLGLQLAALTVALLLARCWGLGGFLLGLMPALHAAMALVLWPWSFLYLLFSHERPRGHERSRLFAAVGAGVAFCAALAFFLFFQPRDNGTHSPYFGGMDGELILRNFNVYSDYHRRPFPFFHPGYFLNLLSFSILGGILLANASQQQPQKPGFVDRQSAFWVLLFGGLAWAWVYAARVLHLLAGAFPRIFEQVMPNRLSNFSTLLLVPLAVVALGAIVSGMRESPATLTLALVTIALGGTGILLWFVGISPWHFLDIIPRHLLFGFWGLLFAADLFAHWPQPRRRLISLAAAATLAGAIILSPSQSISRVAFVAGYLLTLAILGVGVRLFESRLASGRWKLLLQPALLLGMLLTCSASLPGYRLDRNGWDRLTRSDRELKDWLDKYAAPDEPVLTPPVPRAELQTKTGHPVLMELETLYVMTYMPRLAPVIAGMMRDLYGVDYSDTVQLPRLAVRGRVDLETVWIEIWKNRTREDWQALARKYHFRLVLSPVTTTLKLPESFRSGGWILYSIPEGASAATMEPGIEAPSSLRSP